MKTKAVCFAALLVVGISMTAFSSVPYGTNYYVPGSIDTLEPNGTYTVSVCTNGACNEVATLSYDMFYRERTVDLAPFLGDEASSVRVRLEQLGGGAAHVDSVTLGGESPTEALCDGKGLDLDKLSRADFDVVDAYGKTFDLIFPVQHQNKVLSLLARVEADILLGSPFYFPRSNRYRPIDLQSDFYSYALDTVRSKPQQNTPFFKEFCLSGSGHPSEFTYGWVWNDDEFLYVDMDFSGDNTMDGDKDYAEVYVKTESTYRRFRVSLTETRWGSANFAYTNTVPYQHKVYHFRIPLSAVGQSEGLLSLAFSAYGTTTQPFAIITIVKQANPESDQKFSYTGSPPGFSLIDDGSSANTLIFPVSSIMPVTVTENVPAGWVLVNILCVGSAGVSTDVNTATVTINPKEHEAVQCVFENEQVTVPPIPPKKTIQPVSSLQRFGIATLFMFIIASALWIIRRRQSTR